MTLDTPIADKQLAGSSMLKRIAVPWPRRLRWVTDEHRTFGASLATILDTIPDDVRTLYLVGGWDALSTPPREFFTEPAHAGWAIEQNVDRSHGYSRGGTYRRDERTVDVHMAGRWFGAAGGYDADLVRQAFATLESNLKREFDTEGRRGASVMGTPARTGLDLLQRDLPVLKRGRGEADVPYVYPALPRELQEVVFHNIGQGRMQCVAPPSIQVALDAVMLDGRFMYASCLRDLPVSPWQHDEDVPDFEPFRDGFYRVEFRAPSTWGERIGLLSALGDDGPEWPVTPHYWHETWTTEPELRLAYDNGWDIRIRERILAAPKGEPGGDPARGWLTKLLTIRERAEASTHPVAPLVASAAKDIVRGTVGAWHRTDTVRFHSTPAAEAGSIPHTAMNLRPVPNLANVAYWEWHEAAPVAKDLRPFVRPEWSATVWGRCRARLAKAALKIDPARYVLWLRTDGMLLASEGYNPGAWPDDGKVGTFRVKPGDTFHGLFDVPRDEGAYRAFRAQMRGQGMK